MISNGYVATIFLSGRAALDRRESETAEEAATP
jgi:hypothetical protein